MMMAKIVQRSQLYLFGYENMIRKEMCEYNGDCNGDDQNSEHDMAMVLAECGDGGGWWEYSF